MTDPDQLRVAILQQLSLVIDPETGVDIVHMRLIEDLKVNKDGWVTYKFRPSSPLCPIAVPLSLMIKDAIACVPGVTGQDMEVVGYIQSEELTALLRDMLREADHPKKAKPNNDQV
jgi:metal-sulfur cluster biosynthetic enzyme